jgi:MFS family permease
MARSTWRNSDFARLWAGESISLLGSQVTLLALPLTAVLTLDAGAAQVGVLNAFKFAPFFFVTLLAGALVDRWRRRPILLLSNLGRAVLIGLVPLAAIADVLAIEQLYAVAFLVGILTVFFDVAFWSYVPTIVDRRRLSDANGKLMASSSAADVGGPGLGGVLVGVLTAPIALLADALSFLVSAATLASIRRQEPAPAAGEQRLLADIREGLNYVFRNPFLRPIAAEAATFNVFSTALETVFLVYAVRVLGFGPALVGLVFAVGSVGALLGSLVAGVPERRLGIGPTIVLSMIAGCLPYMLIPLADGSGAAPAALAATAFFLAGIGIAVSNVQVISFRQAITPERLLGRMTASYRFAIFGTIPLGALLGGGLAEWIGLREALAISAVGIAAAPLWVLFSPVSRVREPAERLEPSAT